MPPLLNTKDEAEILHRRMKRARTFVAVVMITYAIIFLFLIIYGYSTQFKGLGSLFDKATRTDVIFVVAPIMVLPFIAAIFGLVQLRAFRKLVALQGLGTSKASVSPVTPKSPVVGKTKKILIEVFGWYGAAGLLSAYLLSSFGVLHPDQVLYQVLNITAAIGIVVVSLSKKNYQPAVLDIIWATVGIISLVRILFF